MNYSKLLYALLLISLFPVYCSNSEKNAKSEEPPKDNLTKIRTLDRDPNSPYLNDEQLASYLTDHPDLQTIETAIKKGKKSKSIGLLNTFLENHKDYNHRLSLLFLLGTLYLDTQNYENALDSFEAIPTDWLLSDYCHYYAAKAASKLERPEIAIEHIKKISSKAILFPRARHLLGNAFLQSGDYKKAADTLRTHVKNYPKASYRSQVEFDLALALVEEKQWSEAAAVFRSLSNLYPQKSLGKKSLKKLEDLLPYLKPEETLQNQKDELTDLLTRSNNLFKAHRSDQVIQLLTPALTQMKEGSENYCEASFLIGSSYKKLRKHNDSLPYFTQVTDHCSKMDHHIKALYLLGKAYWNVDQDPQATTTFQKLRKEYPKHSYADDTLLFEARIARSAKDNKLFRKNLKTLIADYPEGDMRKDAIWLLFVENYSEKHFQKALTYLESIGNNTSEDDLYSLGRLAYFRGRCYEHLAQTGSAIDVFESLIRTYPLSYFALLSFGRLKELDPSRATQLREDLHMGFDTFEAPRIRLEPPQVASNPFFKRGIELLRLGLYSAAKKEFKRLEREFEHSVEILWLVAFLYDRAQVYHLSHDIPRRRLNSFMTTYPDRGNLYFWFIAFPRPFLPTVKQRSEDTGLPVSLIYAITREESGFNPSIESWANAVGLMQLMWPTAERMAKLEGISITKSDLKQPDTNLRLGSAYLALLAKLYASNPALVFGSYHAGEGNMGKWLTKFKGIPLDLFVEELPYGRTRQYIKRVLTTYWVYTWLYGEDGEIIPVVEQVLPEPKK